MQQFSVTLKSECSEGFTRLATVAILVAYFLPTQFFGENQNMSVDAKAEVVIERSRSEVAAVMFDAKSDVLWITGLKNSFPQTSGLMTKGFKFERVGTLLGRYYSCIYLVTRSEDETFVEIAADEPFQMKIRYDLADADGGTRTSVRIQSIGDTPYTLPPASLNKAIKEWIEGDLQRLKKRLESES